MIKRVAMTHEIMPPSRCDRWIEQGGMASQGSKPHRSGFGAVVLCDLGLDLGGHQCRIAGSDCTIREVLAVLQSDPRRPTPLMGNGDQWPDRRIETVKQDWPAHACVVEFRCDGSNRLQRRHAILLADFNQD